MIDDRLVLDYLLDNAIRLFYDVGYQHGDVIDGWGVRDMIEFQVGVLYHILNIFSLYIINGLMTDGMIEV